MGAHWHWFKTKGKSGVTKLRPDWAGPVVVEFEQNQGARRQSRVRGIVVTTSTAGRDNPPEPSSGARVGFSVNPSNLPASYRHNATTGQNWHNDGSPIVDKGHIMAIEIGGSDVAENIVPQLADCQEHGAWRKMETSVKALADTAAQAGDVYLFTAILSYSRVLEPTFSVPHRVLTPSHFYVTLHKLSKAGLPSPFDEAALDRIDLSNAPAQVVYDGGLDLTERDDLESARMAQDMEITQQVANGVSREDAEKSAAEMFPDVTTKFETTKKTKVRTNKSIFNANYKHMPPSVSFKPRRTTPSQTKVNLEGSVRHALRDEVKERRRQAALQDLIRRRAEVLARKRANGAS